MSRQVQICCCWKLDTWISCGDRLVWDCPEWVHSPLYGPWIRLNHRARRDPATRSPWAKVGLHRPHSSFVANRQCDRGLVSVEPLCPSAWIFWAFPVELERGRRKLQIHAHNGTVIILSNALTYNVQIDIGDSGGRLAEVHPAFVDGLIWVPNIVQNQSAGIMVAAKKGPSSEDIIRWPMTSLFVGLVPGIKAEICRMEWSGDLRLLDSWNAWKGKCTYV